MFTSLYVGFLPDNAMAYLLFLAVTPSLIILATQLFLNHVPFIQESELRMDTGRLPLCNCSEPLWCGTHAEQL